MRKLVFFVCFAFALSLEIGDIYYCDKTEVYSSDVFDTDKKIFLFSFKSSFLHQIPRRKLSALLEEHNISAGIRAPIVYFYKISPLFMQDLKSEIISLYATRGVIVDKISLKPSSIVGELSLGATYKIEKDFFSKSSGTITISYNDGGDEKFLKFFYEISGYQEMPVATVDIRRGRQITQEKYIIKRNKIQHRLFEIPDANLSEFQARSIIKKGSIIEPRKIQKLYAVKSGNNVNAFMKDGAVTINFVLKAKENGYIGDEIKLQDQKKKIFYGVITGQNTVKIQ
ncbi:MAG: flagellar basal body P-ring formation chaperone FlgA [Helicobacteraceae bacterium]